MRTTNLKKERLEKGWTLEQVGQQIGISNQAVSAIEALKIKPSYDVLLKLENLFSKDHRYLFAQGTETKEAVGQDGQSGESQTRSR
jgi:transcriptional regulator with XRE-family HTH domain